VLVAITRLSLSFASISSKTKKSVWEKKKRQKIEDKTSAGIPLKCISLCVVYLLVALNIILPSLVVAVGVGAIIPLFWNHIFFCVQTMIRPVMSMQVFELGYAMLPRRTELA